MREDEMEDAQNLDPSLEAAGRRLLTAAFETMPDDGAGSGVTPGELLRRVRRQTSQRRRVRTLVPAGAVVALGGVAALVLALTVASAPSALAAVTAAAAKTSAESFRVTSVQTQVNTLSSDDNGPPLRMAGVFDPAHGLGAETVAGTPVRIIGPHVYVDVTGQGQAILKRWSHGKPWLEGQLAPPIPAGQSLALTWGSTGDEPVDPGALLGLLKSVGSVTAEGPASGPGWTGTRYAFAEPALEKASTPVTVHGTVYVDNQGRVRRLVTTQTWPIWSTLGVKGSATDTTNVTFGGFGVRVSATAPPAGQVYHLGQPYPYLSVSVMGSPVLSGPRPHPGR
jgi:hypothetical protein